jgi:hypothetical protein
VKISGMANIERNKIECAKDLRRYINTSRSGGRAATPTISALLNPRIGAATAKGTAK